MSQTDERPAIKEAFGRNLTAVAHEQFPDRGSLDDAEEVVHYTKSLERFLEEAIRSRMPLVSRTYGETDRDALMDDFSESIAVLRQAAEDVKDLVRRLWRLNVTSQVQGEVAGKVAQEFVEEYYGHLTDPACERVPLQKGAVSARLEALSVEEVEAGFRNRLKTYTEMLIGGVHDLFEELRKLELVGQIAWATDDACDSWYCEDRIVHQSGDKTTQFGPTRLVKHADGRHHIEQQNVDVTNIRHTVYHGVHTKTVACATRHPIDEFSKTIPLDIHKFLNETPAWLRETLRIVEGETRYDDVVSIEIDLVNWKLEEPYIQQITEPSFCPLVVLGEYVLTGWGTKDEEVESARQNYRLCYAVAVTLALISGVMSGLGRLEFAAIGYASLVPMILSVAAFLTGRHQQATASGESPELTGFLTAGLTWFVLCLGIQLLGSGLAVMHGPVLVLGIILIWGGAKGLQMAGSSDANQE